MSKSDHLELQLEISGLAESTRSAAHGEAHAAKPSAEKQASELEVVK